MSLFGLHWALPMMLLLLPLAVLPWINHNREKVVAWIDFVPVDPFSNLIGTALKLLASIAIACLVMALAGPYEPEKKVDRIAEGAEIILLLDRSRSMDDAFAVKHQPAMVSVGKKDSKRRISKQYLIEFVKKRPDDRFGFVLFSAKSIDLLPLTYSKETILATVEASALGKGLSETNMPEALIRAATMFEGEKYRGSRIVLLVSDGGQLMSEEEKQQISELYKRMNLTIYWIYLRDHKGKTLEAGERDNLLWRDIPERKLHTFFKSMDIPYKAFEAGSLEDFADALDEIDKQQYQTLVVQETLPKQIKTKPFYTVALLAILLLSIAQVYTAWGVKKAYE
jgi:mxaC protein